MFLCTTHEFGRLLRLEWPMVIRAIAYPTNDPPRKREIQADDYCKMFTLLLLLINGHFHPYVGSSSSTANYGFRVIITL